jgi:hypothetical protein
MRASSPLLASPASEMGLTAAIAVILLAANFTIANAQQQLTIQPEEIQDGTTAARIFQSIEDSFRLQVPEGWMIHIINNTGSTFETEVQQGYRILAQLCPEEQQQGALSIASTSTNSSSISNANNNCQRTQQELIYIVRYPDLDTKLQLANNVTNHNMTTDNILLYHLQKLQEVGYKGIHIVNSTETTINLTNPDTNQTITRVPAKLVETTYSTVSAPNETRRGYFLLTATNATAPNPGTTKGYTIFYEGSSLAAAITAYGSLLPPIPVRQVFDSFQLIAAPEVAQAIAQQAQAAETAEGRGGDNNDNGAHEHRGNDRDNNNNDNGAHEHRGNDRDNRGHDGNGHGHNNGNGNREGGQGLAERIIEKTERMVDRIMSRP